MKYCRHCGAELGDNAAFCPRCGEKVSAPQTERKDTADPRPSESRRQYAPAEMPSAEKKPINWKAIAIAVVIIALIAGGGAMLAHILNGRDKTEDTAVENAGNHSEASEEMTNGDSEPVTLGQGTLSGTYLNDGLAIQLNSDQTFYVGDGTENVYYLYGTYLEGDENVYLNYDRSEIEEKKSQNDYSVLYDFDEQVFMHYFSSFFYDKTADALVFEVEGQKIVFTRDDSIVLTAPRNSKESNTAFIFDFAGLLSPEEVNELEIQANKVSANSNCGVYIITVDNYLEYSSSDSDVVGAAIELYTTLKLGVGGDNSGTLLLLSMADRDYALIAHGNTANYAFTDYGKEQLSTEFLDDFKHDDWYGGFLDYLSGCDDYLRLAQIGNPVDDPSILNYARERKDINVFISNFSEAHFPSMPSFYELEPYMLVNYAYVHAKINNRNALSIENGYYAISADTVDDYLKKFFGETVPRQSYSKTWNGAYTETVEYLDGKYLFPAADGENYDLFSVSISADEVSDGLILVSFNVYGTLNGTSLDSSFYSMTEVEASANSNLLYCYSGTAEIYRESAGQYTLKSYNVG